ncbi:MAG: capsular polysaccharide biosynthesis protein [Luteolibacter sp.]
MNRLELERQELSVGWGYRPSGRAAIRDSSENSRTLLLLEDGLIRSLRPGAKTSYSLVADSRGIYYDCSGRSDLIEALNSGSPKGWMRDGPGSDVAGLMNRFREHGISKYNWYPGEFNNSSLPEKSGVLVVDQTRGDTSLEYGGMRESDFDRMVRDALDEHPGEPIYVRSHPDHRYRGKHSCFSPWVFEDSRVTLLPPDLSPAQCFSFCREIYVGTSLMGMEGLIHGCKVKAYGWNFHTGWGLTEDRGTPCGIKRERKLTLPELFRAAYLQYTHYFDPDSGESCGLSEIIDHLALQKEMFAKNRGHSVSVGFSPWKKKIVSDYLRSADGQLTQLGTMPQAETAFGKSGARLLVWGRKPEIPTAFQGRAIRVEDGFIRSKGLGAAFNFPYSWVLDSRGIYFDPTAPSDLEVLLNQGFPEKDLIEAASLIQILREKRLTKYNLSGDRITLDPEKTRGQKVILVPGQVEADASIAFGSPVLKSNVELLRAVRKAEPDAFLIFKAHPDLVAGARHGSVLPSGYDGLSDLAVTDGNVLDWLDLCDEVHTMTSTVGFEALIRNVPVVTYGLPFYSGWGLTTDRLECPRRIRRLTLEELVCGALMKYPRYLNPATGEFTTALKVTRLLTSDGAAGDQRAWHLKTVSKLKKLWVELAR